MFKKFRIRFFKKIIIRSLKKEIDQFIVKLTIFLFYFEKYLSIDDLDEFSDLTDCLDVIWQIIIKIEKGD